MGAAQSDVSDNDGGDGAWGKTKANIMKQSDKYLMGKVGHEGPRQGEPLRNCCYCPDVLFFFLWLTCFLCIFSIGTHYGIGETAAVMDDDYGHESSGSRYIFSLIALALFWSMLIAAVWAMWTARSGSQVMQTAFTLGCAALCIVGFLEDVSSYQWYFGIGLFLIAVCGALSYRVIRDVAPHRLVTLKVGCQFVKSSPALETLMCFHLIVAALLCLWFAFCIIGLLYHFQGNGVRTDYQQLDNKNTAYIMVILMFLYCAQVLRNIMICTTAGTLAEWWYQYSALDSDHHAAKPSSHSAACDTYRRAWTYSLPPICYGSFVIAPFETIYSFASLFKGPCQMICPPVAELLDKCGELYHGYAYVFIGTHGYSLMTAGRKTFSLFVNEGVAVMENDCVIETLCLWADITIACITSVIAIMMVDHGPDYWTRGVDCPRTLCGLIGLFCGWCISGVATGVVVGANKAVLTLFLENPHVLEDTHPNEHKELTQAWRIVEKKEVPTTAHIAVHEPEDGAYGLA